MNKSIKLLALSLISGIVNAENIYVKPNITNKLFEEVGVQFKVIGKGSILTRESKEIAIPTFQNFRKDDYVEIMKELENIMISKNLELNSINVIQKNAKKGYAGFKKDIKSTYNEKEINIINGLFRSTAKSDTESQACKLIPNMIITKEGLEINLEKLDLKEKIIKYRNIKNTSFENSNLLDSTVENCTFAQNNFDNADLNSVIIQNSILEKNSFKKSNLTDAKITKSTLDENNFDKTNAENLKLKECYIKNTTFKEVDFFYANFNNNSIETTTFDNCNLKNTTFNGTKLTDVIFKNCDFTNADISQAEFKSTITFENTKGLSREQEAMLIQKGINLIKNTTEIIEIID
ncbi:MAG: pentapeptide repeat-containing protein [bacterium]